MNHHAKSSTQPTSSDHYLEFEYAIQQGKALFSVVITKNALETRVKERGSEVLEQDNKQKLDDFRKVVKSNVVRFWDDAKDIKIAVLETLSEYSERSDLIGWIPGDEFVDTSVLAEEIARLNKENADIKSQISSVSKDNNESREKEQSLDDSDAIIMLRNYINSKPFDNNRTKVVIYSRTDESLGFPDGTSKRCLKSALKGTIYEITAEGVNTIEIKIRSSPPRGSQMRSY